MTVGNKLLLFIIPPIGTFAAGIAHEINTPVQFVNDNIQFMAKVYDRIREVMNSFNEVPVKHKNEGVVDVAARDDVLDRYSGDVAALLEEVSGAIDESLEGITRITSIINAMRNYSHVDQNDRGRPILTRRSKAR